MSRVLLQRLPRWRSQGGLQWPQPDFLPRRRRTPAVAWTVLVVGVLLLCAGAARLWQQREELRAQDLARTRWTGELRRLQPAVAPHVGADISAGQGRASAQARVAAVSATVRAANQVDQALRYRWDLLLGGVDASVTTHVQWLRLEHDARRRHISVEGLAPTRDDALRLAEQVARAPGWRQVQLSRVDAGVAGLAARFEVRAMLGDVAGDLAGDVVGDATETPSHDAAPISIAAAGKGGQP